MIVLTLLSLFFTIGTWILLSIAVGVAAYKRCNRDGFGWFLLAFVFSPLIAGAFLIAIGRNEGTRHNVGAFIVLAFIGLIVLNTVVGEIAGTSSTPSTSKSASASRLPEFPTVNTPPTFDAQGMQIHDDNARRLILEMLCDPSKYVCRKL